MGGDRPGSGHLRTGPPRGLTPICAERSRRQGPPGVLPGACARRAGRRRGDRPPPRGLAAGAHPAPRGRSEEHTSELQSRPHLVCRLLLEKKKKKPNNSEESNNVTNNDAPPVSSAHHTGYLRTRDAPSLPVDYIMRRTP